MNECVLSIVIPVYNVQKYLKECVNSLFDQIDDQCEVVLVDDGSTDSSGAMCDVLCEEHSQFRVIHKKNGGLSDARNEGIRQSHGEYILFLDSDDKLSTSCIQIIIEKIKRQRPDALFGRAQLFSEDEDPIEKYNIDSYQKYRTINEPSRAFIELDKNPAFWFAAWLVIIRRDFLIDHDLYFEKGILHEDERWVPLVFLNAKSICLFDEAFYLYRINRAGSIVSVRNIKREFDKLSTAEFFFRYPCAEKNGIELLKGRAAALVFGVILSLKYYKNSPEYSSLLHRVTDCLPVLQHGKYRLVLVLCKVLGVERASLMICSMMK